MLTPYIWAGLAKMNPDTFRVGFECICFVVAVVLVGCGVAVGIILIKLVQDYNEMVDKGELASLDTTKSLIGMAQLFGGALATLVISQVIVWITYGFAGREFKPRTQVLDFIRIKQP